MAESTGARHQPDGIHVRAVVWGGLAIVGGIVLAVTIAWWLWDRWGRLAGPNAGATAEFTRPVLKIAPQQERAQYMAEKQALLESWAWIDRRKGIARIPVEQAMQILAERSGDAAVKERR